jgi:hypothetical protein
MVTAELAVALPALVLAGLLAITGLQVVLVQLQCLDAAGVAARLAGRGETPADVTAVAARTGPRGAQVRLARDGDLVRAEVLAQVHPLGLAAVLPAFSVVATAVSLAEGEASAP